MGRQCNINLITKEKDCEVDETGSRWRRVPGSCKTVMDLRVP